MVYILQPPKFHQVYVFQDSAKACLSNWAISSEDGRSYCSFVRSTVCTLQMPSLVRINPLLVKKIIMKLFARDKEGAHENRPVKRASQL